MMDFQSIADDFFVNIELQTTLALPDSRETVLHFCEAVQKEFRLMTNLYQRESGEYVLEGERDSGVYTWMELRSHRLSAGYFNPPDHETMQNFHRWILDRVVYFLGIGGLDVEALDVLYGFNMDFQGNRSEIVARALLEDSPLSLLSDEHPRRTIEFDPSMVVSLSEDCSTQARLSIETRGSSYQVRTGNYDPDPISAYLAVRRYPTPGDVLSLPESFDAQCECAEDLLDATVIPQVIAPIVAAIAAAG